jgi:lipopolysaccharide/colanic/teichoic acid biosynthesis glycosyltransferase
MLTSLDTLDAPVNETETAILPFRRPAPPRIATPSRMQRLYLPLRRVLDFSLAFVLTLIALPVVGLAALLVRLTSRGPAFYTQLRTGKDGRTFTIYKIRTMLHNCESLTGPRWTIPGDPRITPIGWLLRRTHIDELPQLLNVLLGQMSLIGPRPERPEFVRELERAVPGYQNRHEVLPGITGLAQVQLAPDTDIENVRQKLVYDLYAIEHLSLWLDVRILVATGLHMLGMSYTLLHQLRIVPGPTQVEKPTADQASSTEAKKAKAAA